MQGLALSQAYFEAYGRTMLAASFPTLARKLAVGLFGSGSECFGYDDQTSQDHDFEPGFCIFLPDEDIVSRKEAFALERAYDQLPQSFMGVERLKLRPVGGRRHGVIRWKDFLREHIGQEKAPESWQEWLRIPEYALAEVTNGALFQDEWGEVRAFRENVRYYPADICKKKLAGSLLMMAQSGEYNYARCLAHKEEGAAQLAITEYVKYSMQTFYILNQQYMPFYKWSFRGLRALSGGEELAEGLTFLLTSDNSDDLSSVKEELIADLNSLLLERVRAQGLSKMLCTDLEKHAYSVNDGVENAELRNANILLAV